MQWFTMKNAWLAAGVGLALSAQAASAADWNTNSVTVSLKGLDLASPDGQAIAATRIKSAAKQACGTADNRDLNAMADYKNCRTLALNNATQQVNAMVAAAEARTRLASAAPAR
jgi:UrcA family protein